MNTKAKASVELEIGLPDTWGKDCTVGQVEKQAIDSVKGMLDRVFQNQDVKITSAIRVTVITYSVGP